MNDTEKETKEMNAADPLPAFCPHRMNAPPISNGETSMQSRNDSFEEDFLSLQRSSDATDDEDDFSDVSNCQMPKAPISKKRGQQGAADTGLDPSPLDRARYQDRAQHIHNNYQGRTTRGFTNSNGSFVHHPEGVPREIWLRRPSWADRTRDPPRRRISLDSETSTAPGLLREDTEPATKLVRPIQRRKPIEKSNLRYRYVKLAMSMRRTDLSRRQLLYQNVHAVILANPGRWRIRRRVLAGLLSGGSVALTEELEQSWGWLMGCSHQAGRASL